MNIGRIYGLTCLITGKMYIGQTKRELDRRILGHLSSAKNGSNFLIHKAINKYGFENFYIEEFEIIECETPEDLINDLNTLEEFYIEYYNTFGKGYNMNKGGDNVTFNKEKWLASMEKLWMILILERSYLEGQRNVFPIRWKEKNNQRGFLNIIKITQK